MGIPATSSSQASTRVLSFIAVTMNMASLEYINHNVFNWLITSRTPFTKTISPVQFKGYTGLSRATFNNIHDEDNTSLSKSVGTKLRECEVHYLGMRFVNVHNDMFQGTGGNNYCCASYSLIHNFNLHVDRD
jgi:hypothetical protein